MIVYRSMQAFRNRCYAYFALMTTERRVGIDIQAWPIDLSLSLGFVEIRLGVGIRWLGERYHDPKFWWKRVGNREMWTRFDQAQPGVGLYLAWSPDVFMAIHFGLWEAGLGIGRSRTTQ